MKKRPSQGRISPAKSGAAGCDHTLKSFGVDGIYIDVLNFSLRGEG
jgi:hypothetical protein